MSTPQQQEQRKKMIAYAAFGVVFLGIGIYEYEVNFADNTPAPQTTVQRPVDSAEVNRPAVTTRSQTAAPNTGSGVAAGVAATKMASTSSSLDPTLDERAMLRTESLVYSGNGRNIFSQAAYVPVAELPKNVPNPRVNVPTGPPPPPPPPPTCPPTCAPINLKYFGTVVQSNGQRQAFLLHDDDVYMASQGDIVARRYKIISITANGVQVQDLSNTNTQTLPLQAN
jgi:hypothetical protein